MISAREVVTEGARKFKAWFKNLSTPVKIGLVLGLIVHVAISITVLVNYQKVIKYIVSVLDNLRDNHNDACMFVFPFLISLVGFPPFIGFSSLCVIIGMVYGYQGFPPLAIISSVMSTVSFWVFHSVFTDQSQKFIDSHKNLQIFVSVIKDSDTTFLQEVFILSLIRLCPFPYSITNGGLGCVPNLTPLAFFVATIICSPKYLIQIFIGIQLRELGNPDESDNQKLAHFSLIVLTGASFGTLSTLLYKRLQWKFQQRSSSMDYVPLDTV